MSEFERGFVIGLGTGIALTLIAGFIWIAILS